MPYIHEVSYDWGKPGMLCLRHFRETTSQGGLVYVTELGRTFPMFHVKGEVERQSGLVVPSTDLVIQANLERDEEYVPNMFICQRREEIVHTGLAAWRLLLSQTGIADGVKLCLAQNHRIPEVDDFDDEADDRYMPTPIKYDARPDEIESLEGLLAAIKRNLRGKPEVSAPGLYL